MSNQPIPDPLCHKTTELGVEGMCISPTMPPAGLSACDLSDQLKISLPDSKVFGDVRRILSECGGMVELDDQKVVIPNDAQFAVVCRSFEKYDFPVVLSERFGVIVALGGVTSFANGFFKTPFGFATLWYNSQRELVTSDFYSKLL